LDAPCSEDLVWLALRQLKELHLLEQSISLPPRFTGMSRRQMIRNLGVAAAVAVPLITSLIAPTPAQAATCRHNNARCTYPSDCCSGRCFPGPGHTRCVGS
jgi:hypothetical protein